MALLSEVLEQAALEALAQNPPTADAAAAGDSAQEQEDTEAAVEAAMQALRARPDFESLADAIIRKVVQAKVADLRHQLSQALRRKAGADGEGPARKWWKSEPFRRLYELIYNENISE
jgi:hypothetical protein